jgi:hypothetical protein
MIIFSFLEHPVLLVMNDTSLNFWVSICTELPRNLFVSFKKRKSHPYCRAPLPFPVPLNSCPYAQERTVHTRTVVPRMLSALF